MKKILPILLVLALLAGCRGAPSGLSDADMATRVASILTAMPSNTPGPTQPSAVEPQPTVVEVTLEPSTAEPPTQTAAPKDLPTATETQAPSETPTLTPTGPTPTVQPTSKNGTPTAPATLTPGGPTATFPADDPRKSLGQPTLLDPMDSPDDWVWPSGPSPYTNVNWKDGSMWLSALTKTVGWRLPLVQSEPNMYIEMTARPQGCLSSTDSFGIIFRVPDLRDPVQGYILSVTCGGQYKLWKWDGKVEPKGASKTLIDWKAIPYTQYGPDKSNRIGILADGTTLTVYSNGIKLGSATDSSYTKGAFGVVVKSATDAEDFTVRIDEMAIWHLP